VTSTGASANPTFPPTENQLIPTWLPPLTARAIRAASGWYAATPSPDNAAASQLSQYDGPTPTSAIPSPAVVMATGISQISGRRSVSTPNTGWTTEDSKVAAKVILDTATYPSPRSATRNGTSAGTLPWYTSTHAWPTAISPIGRSLLTPSIVAARTAVRLPIKCQPMPETRQRRPANTGHRPIPAGGGIEVHWHDKHQIVYAGRGVLSVTADAGSWIAPATRAIWVPAGTLHEHRAYGETALHTVGLTENPLGLEVPSALVVSPLLRELILTYTSGEGDRESGGRERGEGQRGGGAGERERLHAVLLDQLRRSPQRPTYLPSPRDPRLAAVCDLLRNHPAGSVTRVAHGCGWASTSAFIDTFRRAFGHTPGSRKA